MKQVLAATLFVVIAAQSYGQKPEDDVPTQTPQEPIVKGFETLDADGDGYVDAVEAEDENVWYHFDAIDKNKDEALSREEFVEYIADENPLLGEELPLEEQPQPYLRERTQEDTDVVTNPELLPRIDTDFGSLDEDNDRHITREEAGNDNVHDHFRHMDEDSDGRVSESEYDNYLYEHGTQVATQELVEELQGLR